MMLVQMFMLRVYMTIFTDIIDMYLVSKEKEFWKKLLT